MGRMGWVSRLFDRRGTFLRLILLDLVGLSYLLLRARPPAERQWVLAILAFVAILAFHRRPALNLALQIVLLGLSFRLLHDATVSEVGAGWAVLELAMWAGRRRTIWFGAGALAVLYLAFEIGNPHLRVVTSLFGLLNVAGLPLLLGLVIRTTRELAEQAARRAALQSQTDRVTERAAIARELHDVVAHHVASMVLRVGVARHVLPGTDPRVTEVFDDLHETGTTALADLRRLVALLRDPSGVRGEPALTAITPAALPAALEAAVDAARRSGLVVAAEIAPEVRELDAVHGLALLRLTQEALTNVAKHAGPAAQVTLTVARDAGDLHWTVADDGGSRALSSVVRPSDGHGLTGMRERAELLGGRLSAGRVSGGWRVHAVLPACVPSAPEPA